MTENKKQSFYEEFTGVILSNSAYFRQIAESYEHLPINIDNLYANAMKRYHEDILMLADDSENLSPTISNSTTRAEKYIHGIGKKATEICKKRGDLEKRLKGRSENHDDFLVDIPPSC